MIESFDIGIFTSTYLIPWGINISLAVMVFVVGKLVANILVGVAADAPRQNGCAFGKSGVSWIPAGSQKVGLGHDRPRGLGVTPRLLS